jgi:hypothetical protein
MPTAEKSTENALGFGASRLKKSGSSAWEAHGSSTGVILEFTPCGLAQGSRGTLKGLASPRRPGS